MGCSLARKTKTRLLGLLARTPLEPFAPGQKLIIEFDANGTITVAYEPGIKEIDLQSS